MNNLNIKSIASAFLSTNNKSKKESLLNDAKSLLESSTNELLILSPAKILKSLELTYFTGRNSSSKVEKGLKKEIDTIILYLSASKNAGFDICKFASEFCRKVCLVESGRASMEQNNGSIHIARLVKTWLVKFAPSVSDKLILWEIDKAVKRKEKSGREFVVRLNGTSDLNFSHLIVQRPNVQFYDYTKKPSVSKLKNHHLTFSFSGDNMQQVFKMVNQGLNIAVPVMAGDFKESLKLSNCYNGDETDLRSYDKEQGKLCLLKIKGNGIAKNPFILDFEEVKQINDAI
jgi:hypothetical protein